METSESIGCGAQQVFFPTFRFENLEIRKGFLRSPNLSLEPNPSLTALAVESELPINALYLARLEGLLPERTERAPRQRVGRP